MCLNTRAPKKHQLQCSFLKQYSLLSLMKFLFSCFSKKSCKRQNGQGQKRFTVQQMRDRERKHVYFGSLF